MTSKLSNSMMSWAIAALCVFAIQIAPAADTETAAAKQKRLIAVLESNAAPGDKAIACKQLAIYGSAEAVPALAPLLSNPELASWARIALEAIPGSAADEALRQAATNLQGRLLVGVINSIGVRGDAKAVRELTAKLKDPDAQVASAAAVALGRIGGSTAAKALRQALSKSPTDVRPAVAEGAVRCAEKFLNSGKYSDAAKLYDTVRKATVPKQKILEATRGAILARKNKGIPLLLESLRSPDRAVFGMALQTARELPGPEATKAVIAEFGRCAPDRQPLILLALAERNDSAALPTIVQAARTGSRKVQLVAVDVLDKLGDVSTLPVLLDAAASPDNDIAQAAKAAIGRLPGTEPDTQLLALFPSSTGKRRQVLIELAALRRLEPALPVIVTCAQDPNAGIRSAAVQTLGAIGGPKEATALVALVEKSQDVKGRDELEAALLAISGRLGASCVPQLLPLMQSADPAVRVVGLHVLASAGGTPALAAVRAGLDDKAESVQDEAVRTLSTWPNTWPEDDGVAEPLLALVKSGTKVNYQVLAVRGYLQYVQGDKKLNADNKVGKIQDLLPLLSRPEEKRLAIAVLRDTPCAAGLEVLNSLASEPSLADEACAAIVDLAATDKRGIAKEARQKALQVVVEKSSNDGTKNKAEAALKTLQ
jgi:HEAT repeat protein